MEFKKKTKPRTPRPATRESESNQNEPSLRASTPRRPARSTPLNVLSRAAMQTKSAAAAAASLLTYSKKTTIIVGIVIAAATAYVIAVPVREHITKNETAAQSVKALESQAILPKDSSITALGGWKQTKTPTDEPIFTYNDTINGIAISVSQQLLPKASQVTTDAHVADIAKKINATNKIDAEGTKLYIGTSTKGPQYVVLTKNNLLILIKSLNTIDDNAWANYAKSLK